MSLTSDRFCIYLRKDSDNTELLKFINGQKSLSASIRLLIKAYMATAKTLDVESADLFDVIDSVSAKSLGSLDQNVVANERMTRSVVVRNVQVTDDEMMEEEYITEQVEPETVNENVVIQHDTNTSQMIEEPVKQPVEQLVKQPVKQPVEQLVKQPVEQPVEQLVKQLVEQPVKQNIEPKVEDTNDSSGSIDDFMGDF